MKKTIKKNVQMRLDELIKYVWDNDIKNLTIKNLDGVLVNFLEDGKFESEWCISKYDLFEVEIEDEITEDTVFDKVVERYISTSSNLKTMTIHSEASIRDVIDSNNYTDFKTLQIYALIDIDDKLELIWEAQDNNGEK